MKNIFLIYTVPMIINDISSEVKKEFKDALVSNVLDDYILTLFDISKERVKERLENILHAIKTGDDDTVVITCSSLSQIAKDINPSLVLIDEYMLKKAATFQNILIVATAKTTIEPTTKGLCSHNSNANIDVCFVANAIDFYKSGDKETHDRYVIDALKDSCSKKNYDVIVMAQASLAS